MQQSCRSGRKLGSVNNQSDLIHSQPRMHTPVFSVSLFFFGGLQSDSALSLLFILFISILWGVSRSGPATTAVQTTGAH